MHVMIPTGLVAVKQGLPNMNFVNLYAGNHP